MKNQNDEVLPIKTGAKKIGIVKLLEPGPVV